jgi:hypothetical protein
MLVTPAGIVTLVSEVARENAAAPMLVTLDGIVTLVREYARAKADSPILVTPSGITTAPIHDDPLVTTPPVIVKFGVELDSVPDVHWYVPLLGAAAITGLTTIIDAARARAVVRIATLRIVKIAFCIRKTALDERLPSRFYCCKANPRR